VVLPPPPYFLAYNPESKGIFLGLAVAGIEKKRVTAKVLEIRVLRR
jgi:hypothetical protein